MQFSSTPLTIRDFSGQIVDLKFEDIFYTWPHEPSYEGFLADQRIVGAAAVPVIQDLLLNSSREITENLLYVLSVIPQGERVFAVWSAVTRCLMHVLGQIPSVSPATIHDIDLVFTGTEDISPYLEKWSWKRSTLGAIKRFPEGSHGISFDIRPMWRAEYRDVMNRDDIYRMNNIPYIPPHTPYEDEIHLWASPANLTLEEPSIFTVLGRFSFTMAQVAYDIRKGNLIDAGAINAIKHKVLIRNEASSQPERRDLMLGIMRRNKFAKLGVSYEPRNFHRLADEFIPLSQTWDHYRAKMQTYLAYKGYSPREIAKVYQHVDGFQKEWMNRALLMII